MTQSAHPGDESAERDRLRNMVQRVLAVADHYEQMAAQLPKPHGPVTVAFTTAARDIRGACEVEAAIEGIWPRR